MAFGKKKQRPDRDDFGEKDLPFVTSEKALEFQGIKPLRGSSQRSVEIRRKSIIALLIAIFTFFTVAAGVSLVSNGKTSSLKTQVEQNASPAFKSRYDSLGESIIRTYFAHQTPPVNLMSNVEWTAQQGSDGSGNSSPVDVEGLSLIEAYQTDFNGGDIDKKDKELFSKPKNEVLRYSGVIDGRQYEFGVYLIIPNIDDPQQLPYLVSPPTILPMDRLVTADVEGSKPTGEDFEEAQLNEGTINNITRWASAYAQNDSDTLKSLTGDNRVEAVYPGVGGFSLEGNPEDVWAYQYEDKETGEQRIVARVQFSMSSTVSSGSSNSDDISGSSSDGKFSPLQVMDILLGNFDEGEADILAWGPGGMWQTLRPRMNAVMPVVTGKDGESEDGDSINDPSEKEQPTGENLSPSESNVGSVPGAPSLSQDTDTPTSTSEDKSSSTTSSSKKSKSSKHKSHKHSTKKTKSSSDK